MNISSVLTKDYENELCQKLQKNKPNSNPIPQRDTQYAIRDTRYKPNLSRRSTCCKSAEAGRSRIKPNFKSEGRSEKWNVSRSSSDLYYRIMQKSRDQIYNELLVLKCQQGSRDARLALSIVEVTYHTLVPDSRLSLAIQKKCIRGAASAVPNPTQRVFRANPTFFVQSCFDEIKALSRICMTIFIEGYNI